MPIQKIQESYHKLLANPIESIYRDPTYYDNCPNKTREVYKSGQNCCKTNSELTRRSASTVMNNSYYQTLSEYRYSKCKTYGQTQYNYSLDGNGQARGNCGSDVSACNVVYYKPINKTYGTNTAVSSSNHIHRKRYNAIRTTANLSDTAPRYHHSVYKQTPMSIKNLNSPQHSCIVLNKLRHGNSYCT